MQETTARKNKERKTDLLLFASCFIVYFLNFPDVFLHLNSLLSSITLDSIKNYYTFVYHIKADRSALHFTGMNYPFGEHVVFTDCQPLVTWLLRPFPFLYDCSIGIMHGLIFFSFIITPLILLRIFRLFRVQEFPSILFSLGIAVLSPQFLKVNGGHFALAYGCLIPMNLLLTVRSAVSETKRSLLKLFLYNTGVFFLHPYMGFCLSAFSFLCFVVSLLQDASKRRVLKEYLRIFAAGIAPIVLFSLFMKFTDQHNNRTQEPFGSAVMVENLSSIFSPEFGPFESIMNTVTGPKPEHFEGHSYAGFSVALLLVLTLITLPIWIRRRIDPLLLSFFAAGTVILFISFGYHHLVLDVLRIKINVVNQFRAVCRFAWVFYFVLPVFLIVVLHDLSNNLRNEQARKWVLVAGATIFLILNVVESYYMFNMHRESYWKFRNIFNPKLLNQEEQKIISAIKQKDPQAILPLPIFHGGSEMYDRVGSSNSMVPSMLYSYHSGLPILSAMLSRTSMTETEDLINVLNSYKKEQGAVKKFNKKDFLVIRTNDALLPDETRLERNLDYFQRNDTLAFAFVSKRKLLQRKTDLAVCEMVNPAKSDPCKNVLYLPFKNEKPYITSNMEDYEKAFVLDSNFLAPGRYVVSFHYYYKEKKYQSLSTNLIVAEGAGTSYRWIMNIPVRIMSGFYRGFGVVEQFVNIKKGSRYEFILKGLDSLNYRISDFMLRPDYITTIMPMGKDSIINNFGMTDRAGQSRSSDKN
jgi:hypothetical protein